MKTTAILLRSPRAFPLSVWVNFRREFQILLINLHIWVCAASERSRNASTPELGDLPQQFSIFIRNLVVHVSKEQNSPSLYWIGPSIFYRNGHKRLLNHEILSLCTHSTNSALSRTRKVDRHASRGVNKNFYLVSLLEIGLTKYDFAPTSQWIRISSTQFPGGIQARGEGLPILKDNWYFGISAVSGQFVPKKET